jgi:biotin operon repressor
MAVTATGPKSAVYRRYRAVIVTAISERLAAAEKVGLRPDDLGEPDAIARRAAAVIPVGHSFDETAGPFYDTAGLTEWLGISRQAVHKAVRAGRLLGVRTRDRHTLYPVWQFTDDGGTINSLAQVLHVLDAPADPWRAALWLGAPAPYLPNQTPAATWLARGHDPDRVIAAAREDAARWVA